MRFKLVLLVLFASAFIGQTVNAQIDFNFIFEDVINNTGVGFDDATFGAQRQATLNAVGDYFNTIFDENGTVDITVSASQTDGSGFLAAAGPLFFTGPNGFSNGLAFTHATTGTDPFAGETDGSLTFDFGFNFNSDLSSPTSGQFDLFTVALHEVNHILGFVTNVTASGTSSISGGDPGVFSVFDSLLVRGDGTALFANGGNFIGTPADLTSDDVFFSGANAVAANGGELVQIFAPTTFAPGSSLGHLDDTAFPDAVSQFSTPPGVERRELSEVEIGLFQDLGFTIAITSVPEPATTTLLVVGCAGVMLLRRRK